MANLAASQYYANDQQIALGKKLGSGADGAIYETTYLGGQSVLKLFHKPVTERERQKIEFLINTKSPDLHAIAPLPLAFAYSTSNVVGLPVGFLMYRVKPFEEIQNVISPGERLKRFPDRDWTFLLGVARNLSAVVHQTHDQKIVIGDLNDRNLAVHSDGRVTIMDADSWQVSDGKTIYRCNKGVPNYTSPELQGKRFADVNRTQNHDAFGLAVLIFQLLFLGRHPFTGIYRNGTEDMPTFRAISEGRFAFGKNAAQNGMRRPVNTVELAIVGTECSELFERAFALSSISGMRPTAQEWFEALGRLQKSLVVCSSVSNHAHPNSLVKCPWCELETLSKTTVFPVQHAVEWRKIEQLADEASKVSSPTFYPIPTLDKSRIAKRLGSPSWLSWDLKRFNSSDPVTILRRRHKDLLEQWVRLENGGYAQSSSDADFLSASYAFKSTIGRFGVYKSRLSAAAAHEVRIDKQLKVDQYLATIRLLPNSVPGIGAGTCGTLYSFGIRNAADIVESKLTGIPGIGPVRASGLMAWRIWVESNMPAVHATPVATNSLPFATAGIREGEIRNLRLEMEAALTQLQQARAKVESARQKAYEDAANLKLQIEQTENALIAAVAAQGAPTLAPGSAGPTPFSTVSTASKPRRPANSQSTSATQPAYNSSVPVPPSHVATQPTYLTTANIPLPASKSNGQSFWTKFVVLSVLVLLGLALWWTLAPSTPVEGTATPLSTQSSTPHSIAATIPAVHNDPAGVVLPTGTSEPYSPKSDMENAVTLASASVFSKPNGTSPVRCTLRADLPIWARTSTDSLTGSNDFTEILSGTGCRGFVYEALLSRASKATVQTAPVAPVPKILPSPEPALPSAIQPGGDIVATIQRDANLRSGPGMEYCVVATRLEGREVTVDGTNEGRGWYHLKGDNWIAAFLLNDVDSATQLPVISVSDTATTCVTPTPSDRQ